MMRAHRGLALAGACLLLLAGCASPPSVGPSQPPAGGTVIPAQGATPAASTRTPVVPQSLAVFAASSLTGAFNDIGKAFMESHAGVQVIFNFAGSQDLRAQLLEGARGDVFASANKKEMDAVVGGGLAASDAPRLFAANLLTVILPADNRAGLKTLQDLARPGLKLILAAEDVPVGGYARQALGNLEARYGRGYKDRVLRNVVSNETDVKQVVAKIKLGEGDAGIVYTSDAAASPGLATLPIPADLNVVAVYPIAPLLSAAHPQTARAFVDFVLSGEGQAILARWGFMGPVPKP